MDPFLLSSIFVTLMFVGTRSESYSQSCTMVNGKQTCTSDRSNGNVAMSNSQSGTGGSGSSYQSYSSNYAGTGDTGSGRYNYMSAQSGNPPRYGGGMSNGGGYVYSGGIPQFGGGSYAAAGGIGRNFDPFAFVFGGR